MPASAMCRRSDGLASGVIVHLALQVRLRQTNSPQVRCRPQVENVREIGSHRVQRARLDVARRDTGRVDEVSICLGDDGLLGPSEVDHREVEAPTPELATGERVAVRHCMAQEVAPHLNRNAAPKRVVERQWHPSAPRSIGEALDESDDVLELPDAEQI